MRKEKGGKKVLHTRYSNKTPRQRKFVKFKLSLRNPAVMEYPSNQAITPESSLANVSTPAPPPPPPSFNPFALA